MRDYYDNPSMEELLDEQLEKFPQGPLAVLLPDIQIADGLPIEATRLLVRYLSGNLTTHEFGGEMERIRLKQLEKPSLVEL
ncbi:MAG: hypothetical protein OEV21_07675 [Thermoplasmata archaeon]|nr:hypothetical protein [Thermoplasmata archaeon]